MPAGARFRFPNNYTVKHQRRAPAAKRGPKRAVRTRPVQSTPPDVDLLTVRAAANGWSLIVEDIDEPAWTVSTKRKAIAAAKESAKDLEAKLIVETRAGDTHKSFDFRS